MLPILIGSIFFINKKYTFAIQHGEVSVQRTPMGSVDRARLESRD